MTTSLAQQLGQLKLAQKDEIAIPTRTKISFLFDIKQAANIDDQTLFYICQSGIKQLEGILDLSAFQSDLFSENSLQFYRGGQTKDALVSLDAKLELVIKLLAPHMLETGAHKVLEYLLRIYEIHVNQKVVLLNAFLPYFETSYFLKMVQCLALEKDAEYSFLHQYAYRGEAIDQDTLVKALSRQSGLVFIKYSEFCFSLLDQQTEASDSLHWKFFGSMLVQVLRAKPDDQTLMYNTLPYISRCLKQTAIKDLKIGAFLAISQISCRQTLSTEYTQAFVRQILNSVVNAGLTEDDVKQQGLTVLLLLAKYQEQALPALKAKDFKLLVQEVMLPKLVQKLAQKYDASPLAKLVITTVL